MHPDLAHQLCVSFHDHGSSCRRDEKRRLAGCCLSGAQHLRLMVARAAKQSGCFDVSGRTAKPGYSLVPDKKIGKEQQWWRGPAQPLPALRPGSTGLLGPPFERPPLQIGKRGNAAAASSSSAAAAAASDCLAFVTHSPCCRFCHHRPRQLVRSLTNRHLLEPS